MFLPGILTLLLGFCPQDPAHRWFTVTAASDRVSATALAQVQDAAFRALEVLQRDFPALPRQPFRIYLHDTRAAMPTALRAVHHEGSPGFALLARHEIHLVHSEVAANGRGFWPVVLHEMAHEFLHQHAEPNGRYLPRWFHEGFAQAVAQDIYLGASEDSLIWEIRTSRLHGLRQLAERFPDDPDDRRLAYAHSYSYVAWLERRFGRALVIRCAGMVDADDTIERALVMKTGWTTEELEQAWRRYVLYGSGANWRVLGDQCFSLMLVMTLPLLALAMIRRLRRDRLARQRLDRDSWDPERLDFIGPPLPPEPEPDPESDPGSRDAAAAPTSAEPPPVRPPATPVDKSPRAAGDRSRHSVDADAPGGDDVRPARRDPLPGTDDC